MKTCHTCLALILLSLMPCLMLQAAPVAQSATASDQAVDRKEGIRKRTAEDRKTYTPDQLREIEQLYQVANKQWRSQEAKESLKTLIAKYPKANRTGCALLYMGQMSSSEEKENYLKQAIKDFGDCFYGDGVQVGAYARYHLGYYYQSTGKSKEAQQLFNEIRKDYPTAITHKGKLLVDSLPKE